MVSVSLRVCSHTGDGPLGMPVMGYLDEWIEVEDLSTVSGTIPRRGPEAL